MMSESELVGTDYAKEDFLAAIEEHDPAFSREIAEEVGCSIQTVRDRLKRLAEKGEVRTKSDGEKSKRIWRPADE